MGRWCRFKTSPTSWATPCDANRRLPVVSRRRDAGRRAYNRGHIPGAIYASLDDDLSATDGPGRHPLPGSGRLRRLARSLGHRTPPHRGRVRRRRRRRSRLGSGGCCEPSATRRVAVTRGWPPGVGAGQAADDRRGSLHGSGRSGVDRGRRSCRPRRPHRASRRRATRRRQRRRSDSAAKRNRSIQSPAISRPPSTSRTPTTSTPPPTSYPPTCSAQRFAGGRPRPRTGSRGVLRQRRHRLPRHPRPPPRRLRRRDPLPRLVERLVHRRLPSGNRLTQDGGIRGRPRRSESPLSREMLH